MIKSENQAAAKPSGLSAWLDATPAVSPAKVEEIISLGWIIAAVLCFGFGFTVWGWMFAIKAGLDTGCAIYIAVREVRAEMRRVSSNAIFSGGEAVRCKNLLGQQGPESAE